MNPTAEGFELDPFSSADSVLKIKSVSVIVTIRSVTCLTRVVLRLSSILEHRLIKRM